MGYTSVVKVQYLHAGFPPLWHYLLGWQFQYLAGQLAQNRSEVHHLLVHC